MFCIWYLVEEQFLYSGDDFEIDLYQDRNYTIHEFDCSIEEDEVYELIMDGIDYV